MDSFGLLDDARLDAASAQSIVRRAYEGDVALEVGVARGRSTSWVRSRFLESTSLEKLELAVLTPLNAAGQPQLRQGDDVLVYWTLGASGFALLGRVESLGQGFLPTGVPTHVTRVAGRAVYRHQRREFLRVTPSEPLPADVWFDDLRHEEWPPEGLAPGLRGHVEDLSLGGVRLRFESFTEEEYAAYTPQSVVRVSLTLPRYPQLRYVVGEVVRAHRESHPRRAFWSSVKWRRLTEEQTSALSKYVLDAERQMLRVRRDSALRQRDRGR
jgi:hypothetical protein